MPGPPLRIFIADEHEIVRRGMASLLREQEGWEVCGEASDGAEAVEKIAQLAPDIVLLDIGMPKMDGLAVTQKIIENRPFPKVILLSLTDVEQLVREALKVGARGLVIKTHASRDLVPSVEMVQQGRTFFPPHITELIVQGYLKGENATDISQKNKSSANVEVVEQQLDYRQGGWNRKRIARWGKRLLVATVLAVTGVIAWYTDFSRSESKRSVVDGWFVRAGLKNPSSPTYLGNPDAKVWIDVHTALYYCPGSPLYGKTAKGHFAKQRQAQIDQFEPASRKACD